MNYLAHAYLSFNHPSILVGQMISDYVKGKKQYQYDLPIQKGIQLHRAIDAFTDAHAATHEAKQFFRKDYRLYAGAFVDVVYDYFLANDKNIFPSAESLMHTAFEAYLILNKNQHILPEKFKKMLPFMEQQNWLYNYQFLNGIEKSLGGLVRRSKYLTDSHPAFLILQAHEKELQNCYNNFFPDVKKMVESWLFENKPLCPEVV